MENPRKAFIAMNGNGASMDHFLVEVIPSGFACTRRVALAADEADALIHWRSIGELVAALETSGPLLVPDARGEMARCIGIDRAIDIASAGGLGGESGTWRACKPRLARAQMLLDGKGGAHPSLASVKRDILAHGLFESGADEDLEMWRELDPGCMVVAEPLADVMLVRNICSILLRVIANYQAGYEDPLSRAGFFGVADRHIIALGYDRVGRASTRLLGGGFTQIADPLIDYGATLLTDYDDPLFFNWLDIPGGRTEREAAEELVFGYAKAFSCLPAGLGWDIEPPSLERNGYPEPVFRTLAAAVVGAIVYRTGVLPTTCKECGVGMLISAKGKRREYCSDSCRSTHCMRRKEA